MGMGQNQYLEKNNDIHIYQNLPAIWPLFTSYFTLGKYGISQYVVPHLRHFEGT